MLRGALLVVLAWAAIRYHLVSTHRLESLAALYAGVIAECANGRGFAISNTAVLCYAVETRGHDDKHMLESAL